MICPLVVSLNILLIARGKLERILGILKRILGDLGQSLLHGRIPLQFLFEFTHQLIDRLLKHLRKFLSLLKRLLLRSIWLILFERFT